MLSKIHLYIYMSRTTGQRPVAWSESFISPTRTSGSWSQSKIPWV